MAKPALTFVPGSVKGFTSTGITGFRELDPTAVVRELIQNSLDAVAGTCQPQAVVEFKAIRISTADIPGIAQYRRALELAVACRDNGSDLSEQERMIVASINSAIEKDELDALVVSDNGIGLNCDSMHALLADGRSKKSGNSSGAFGNGHVAVIPASDLRYVLYGGKGDDGLICSGQAILASHHKPGAGHPRPGANGYFIAGYAKSSEDNPYKFGSEGHIPPLISNQLKALKSDTGTVVVVPAFNSFRVREKKYSLRNHIAQAASCNFFPAISRGTLKILFSDERDCRASQASLTLDKNNIAAVLAEFETEKRSKFLSGSMANQVCQAIYDGERYKVPLTQGTIDVYIHQFPSFGSTRIDLYRNGMWITHNRKLIGAIPELHHSHFGEYEAFHAILLLNSDQAPEFHRLVRLAEGPLHNELTPKIMSANDRTSLKAMFKELYNWFTSVVPKQSSDEFSPKDVLMVPLDGEAGSSTSISELSHNGHLLSLPPQRTQFPGNDSTTGGGTGIGAGGGSGRSGKKRTKHTTRSAPAYFTVVAVPGNKRGVRKIEVQSSKAVSDLELRLHLDENDDETSIPIWGNKPIEIRSAMMLYEPKNRFDLVKGESGYNDGIKIDTISENSPLSLCVTYVLPEIVTQLWPRDTEPNLRVEIARMPSAQS